MGAPHVVLGRAPRPHVRAVTDCISELAGLGLTPLEVVTNLLMGATSVTLGHLGWSADDFAAEARRVYEEFLRILRERPPSENS